MDHKDAIKRYHQRRAARLGFRTIEHYDSIEQYRRRRAERMSARMDADSDDETASAGGAKKGGHGNTKIPFGLCQREGIEIQKGWTPEDAWKALEGKGYSAGETYKELKKTGKVKPKSSGEAHTTAKPKKDYSVMSYDDLASEYESLVKRYEAQEDTDYKNKRKAQEIQSSLERLKRIQDRKGYNGETYEQVSQELSPGDKNYWKYDALKDIMKKLGKDAFEKDYSEVEKTAKAEIEHLSARSSYGELNEERRNILNALAEKSKEKYPKLTDCDNALALEARLRADDFFKAGKWLSDRMDYKGMHADNAASLAKGMERLQKKFPSLKGLMPPPIMDTVEGNVWAQVENYDSESPILTVSKYDFQSPYMSQRIKSDTKSGFHPKGTGTVQGFVKHEYGHVIDGILSRKFKDELGGKGFSAYVLDRVAGNHKGESKASIMASVSRYSVNNDADEGIEFLAEAFSEYCCSSKPRPIAKEVGQIMTEFIKRL